LAISDYNVDLKVMQDAKTAGVLEHDLPEVIDADKVIENVITIVTEKGE
jgi:hypothetical protein